jgi:ABC-type phosphate/phosphonate transport system substrate-binding protein
VLYSNYERQVDGLLAGHCDAAWNSPLAWIEAERLAARTGRRASALAMRDSDRDLTSLVVANSHGPVRQLADLRGRRVGVGAADSPQATLIPLLHLAEAGLEPGRDFEVRRYDVLAGKHGDHIGGERDALRGLLAGDVDACCMLDANHLAFAREGTLPQGATLVLAQTGPYDHCNFTVLDTAPGVLVQRFVELLLAMSYEDDLLRPLLDLEGLKAWRGGRVSGYALLGRAVDRFGVLDAFLAERAR